MKRIKIEPLTYIDDLKLNVSKEKKITIENPEQAKDLLKKINSIVAEHRAKGTEIIMGQSLDERTAVSAQVKLKNNDYYTFPEPNPVHLFFSNAAEHFETAKILLKDINKTIDSKHKHSFISFSKYFNEITSGIMMLHTSVEAFINQHIPEHYVFQINGKDLTKVDIEMMDLKQKIKEYLPYVFKIKFQLTNDKEYQNLLKVKDIRNDLIHLKTQQRINKTYYEQLYSRLLNINTDEFIDSVFVFINKIRPDYMKEEDIE